MSFMTHLLADARAWRRAGARLSGNGPIRSRRISRAYHSAAADPRQCVADGGRCEARGRVRPSLVIRPRGPRNAPRLGVERPRAPDPCAP